MCRFAAGCASAAVPPPARMQSALGSLAQHQQRRAHVDDSMRKARRPARRRRLPAARRRWLTRLPLLSPCLPVRLLEHLLVLPCARGAARPDPGRDRGRCCSRGPQSRRLQPPLLAMPRHACTHPPPPSLCRLPQKFLADTNPHKINLGVGAYRDDAGQPVVLKAVREAKRRVAGSHFMGGCPWVPGAQMWRAGGQAEAPLQQPQLCSPWACLHRLLCLPACVPPAQSTCLSEATGSSARRCGGWAAWLCGFASTCRPAVSQRLSWPAVAPALLVSRVPASLPNLPHAPPPPSLQAVKLAYGKDSPAIKGKQVAMLQSLSGTGSCR